MSPMVPLRTWLLKGSGGNSVIMTIFIVITSIV